MKGIAWVSGQDEALRAGWNNPYVTAIDIAIVLDVPLLAVRSRANKLRLGDKAYIPAPPRLVKIERSVAHLCIPGDGGKHVVKISERDLQWFISYEAGWFAHTSQGKVYVYSRDRPPKKLHRLLLNPADTELVDHVNRDGLDNTRNNLRLATHSQNAHNSGPRRQARSVYKGVWLHRPTGLFGGVVTGPDGHRHSIGYYRTEEQAARAHDALAKMFRREFAFQNLPNEQMSDDDIMRHPSLRRAYERVIGCAEAA